MIIIVNLSLIIEVRTINIIKNKYKEQIININIKKDYIINIKQE